MELENTNGNNLRTCHFSSNIPQFVALKLLDSLVSLQNSFGQYGRFSHSESRNQPSFFSSLCEQHRSSILPQLRVYKLHAYVHGVMKWNWFELICILSGTASPPAVVFPLNLSVQNILLAIDDCQSSFHAAVYFEMLLSLGIV